jgi:hypothetical protein
MLVGATITPRRETGQPRAKALRDMTPDRFFDQRKTADFWQKTEDISVIATIDGPSVPARFWA